MTKSTKSNLTAGVLKALGIFGGVEIVNILCSIIRTKLIAIWIGVAGVGLFGLYNSAIELLSVIFSLGIRNSAVRDIATSQKSALSQTIIIIRRWAIILGSIGLISIIASSSILSAITFNNSEHTFAFMAIALIIFMAVIQNGELAILQGTQKLNRLAKSTMWGIIIGVIISAPMFYFWGIDSVLPALITYSLATTIAVMTQRVHLIKPLPQISIKETFDKGRNFIILGIYITFSAIVTNLVSYLFMTYLNHVGDTSIVGFYQAGFTMINKYVGLIFTAIAMEFYPRISQVCTSQHRASAYVSHEMSITLWILVPVIAIFITTNELLVTILYSSEFAIITSFIIVAIIGTLFRAISWCMAFVILARGDGKTFLITESLSAITSITLNIFAYNNWGLNGLGFAYLGWYIIYTLIVGFVYRNRYNLSLNSGLRKLIILSISTAITCVIGYIYVGWYIPAIIAIITTPYSIKYIFRKKTAH